MKDADIAEEQLDIVCEMIKKYFLEVSTVEFSAAACLVEELNVNSSRRAVEIILQCSGCDGNTFCFKDLPVWVQSRYGNEQNVKSGMNVLVKFGGDGTS